MDGFGGPNLPTLPMAGMGMGMGMMNPEMAMMMNQGALALGLGPTDLNMAGMMGPGFGMAPLGGPIAAPMAKPPPPPVPPKYDAPVPGKPIFWKTRICQKWLEGRCHFSDEQCNYAHGKHQLRHVAPELIKQAEQAKQAGEGAQQQQQQGEGGSGSTPAGSTPGDRTHPPPSSQPQPPKQQGGGGVNMDLRKTKPCFEFMQTGQCHMGGRCKYAHGPEELRQPPGSMGGAGGGGMAPKQAFVQEGGSGMPAGPMFKPPPPAGPPPPGLAGLRPPPPAGPPPPGPGMPPAPMRSVHMRPPPPEMGMQQQQHHHHHQQRHPEDVHMHPADQAMRMQHPPGDRAMHMHPGDHAMRVREAEGEEPYFEGGPGASSLRAPPPPDVPLVERVRAMCALLGVGEALGKPDPSAVQAAMMATRSGVAFQETAYADSIETFIHHSAAPEPSFGDWH